jgi:hypothetical protein
LFDQHPEKEQGIAVLHHELERLSHKKGRGELPRVAGCVGTPGRFRLREVYRSNRDGDTVGVGETRRLKVVMGRVGRSRSFERRE